MSPPGAPVVPGPSSFEGAAAAVAPLDEAAMAAAAAHQDRLTKPRGSLGRLEAAGTQLAGISVFVRKNAAVTSVAGMMKLNDKRKSGSARLKSMSEPIRNAMIPPTVSTPCVGV